MIKDYLGNRQRINGSVRLVADGSYLIGIKYLGSQPSATVTVSSGDITVKHGTAGAEAVDSTVGASGVVADGTYTTLGAMVDAINASPNWNAYIIDGVRADVSTAALKTMSETTINKKSAVLGLSSDTSAALGIKYRISARRLNYYRSQKRAKLGGPFQSIIRQATARCNTGSGTLTLALYEVDTTGTTATLLASVTPADDTATTLFASLIDEAVRSSQGNDLLVSFTGSGDFPDSGMYLEVIGFVE